MTASIPNTLFLRLEGPLQAWGDPSKFVIRRSMDAPTKSGVIGLICCAMGLSRQAAREALPKLSELAMGVRIDRAGIRWWDWHTVGAKIGILNAKGQVKKTASTGEYETLITRREYLSDASFLVALQGKPEMLEEIAKGLTSPKWPVFLGRKSCPPSVPVLVERAEDDGSFAPLLERHSDIESALKSIRWRPRYSDSRRRERSIDLPSLIEWRATDKEPTAPSEAEVWYDVPSSFDPPVHHPRFVIRDRLPVEVGPPLQRRTPPPPRPRADYKNKEYEKARKKRLDSDCGLCVFCKNPATTVQHITYRRAGGDETQEDLRSLCRLCHDAVTMIEYGQGMGLDRINPEEPQWRDLILAKRAEIVQFRSLEIRRRRLAAEEVE